MEHATLKLIHISLASVSLTGFVLRWLGSITNARWVAHRLVRILPHVIDTLFLASGIWLAIRISQSPIADTWLTAKICGLVAYIVLGTQALNRAKTRPEKLVSFLAAVFVFTWIVSVARLRNPLGFLADWPW